LNKGGPPGPPRGTKKGRPRRAAPESVVCYGQVPVVSMAVLPHWPEAVVLRSL